MQITDFRTPASAPDRSPAVGGEITGSVVEYARFVEVQQRRVRISAEIEGRHRDSGEPAGVNRCEYGPWTR